MILSKMYIKIREISWISLIAKQENKYRISRKSY